MKVLLLYEHIQTRIIFITNNNFEIEKYLYAKFGTYLNRIDMDPDKRVLYEDAIVVEFDDSHLIAHIPGTPGTVKRPLQELNNFLFENIKYSDNLIVLHGAAVTYNGNAYLLLGSTSKGKTTLASYLSSCGFGYITDDHILIEKNTNKIIPFPTPIQLREGGYNILKKLNMCPVDKIKLINWIGYERYVYTPSYIIEKNVDVASVIFICRSTGINDISVLTPSSVLMGLLHSPIVNYDITPDYLKCLVFLSRKMCYDIHYADMDYVKDTIIHLDSKNIE